MCGDWTVTRENAEMTRSQFNVLRRLGGDMGGRVFTALSPVSLRVSLGQIISFTEDVKSHKMLKGGRDGQDVCNISRP